MLGRHHNSQPGPAALPQRLGDDQALLIHWRRRQDRPVAKIVKTGAEALNVEVFKDDKIDSKES